MASRFTEKIESAELRDTSIGAGPVASDPATGQPTNTATPTTDILLIGRTGMGKSTTGNKLLQAEGHKPEEWFEVEPASECKLLTNDKASLRIVDVPGFASADANLGTMREIVTIQANHKLRFHRIVYFFPVRGELPRADATFKEELSVMHYFFGDAIFQNMILVATARSKKSEKNELKDEDLEKFMTVYRSAYKEVAKGAASNIISSERPAIYISLEDTPDDILKVIMSQEVGIPDGIQLKITEGTCAKCAMKLRIRDVNGMKTFTRCSDDGERDKYEDTKCHPFFVRKWNRAERILGGILIIITCGIAYLVGVPWFTDVTEICIHCRNIPGTEGCKQVGTDYVDESSKTTDRTVHVKHNMNE